jgi:hypothetical protein
MYAAHDTKLIVVLKHLRTILLEKCHNDHFLAYPCLNLKNRIFLCVKYCNFDN